MKENSILLKSLAQSFSPNRNSVRLGEHSTR